MSEIDRVAKAIDKCGQERGHRIPTFMVRHLAAAAIEEMESSAPVRKTPQNLAERLPSSDAASSGADTCRHDIQEDCAACAEEEIERLRTALRLARHDMLVSIGEIERELSFSSGDGK